MPSVIIPAHNEEALLGPCLESVLRTEARPLQVVVVPNACRDRTAEVARSFEPEVEVIETDTPGKTNALNLGESRAGDAFPRAFIDGDIVLKPGALDAAFAALGDGVHIASPPPEFESRHATWAVRQFYSALRQNPYFGHGAPNGSGVFVVSREGRSRWEQFPEIISDDGFVELHFERKERLTTDGPAAIVRTPADLRSLIAIQARSRRGTIELKQRFPELWARRDFVGGRTASRLLANPLQWPAASVYAFVRLAERIRLATEGGQSRWLRDESSRKRSTTGEEEATDVRNRRMD